MLYLILYIKVAEESFLLIICTWVHNLVCCSETPLSAQGHTAFSISAGTYTESDKALHGKTIYHRLCDTWPAIG